jgi:hypothetical protein
MSTSTRDEDERFQAELAAIGPGPLQGAHHHHAEASRSTGPGKSQLLPTTAWVSPTTDGASAVAASKPAVGCLALHLRHADLHRSWSAIARFLRTDDAILYTSRFDANTGLFETLLGGEDAVISDQLNHASSSTASACARPRRLPPAAWTIRGSSNRREPPRPADRDRRVPAWTATWRGWTDHGAFASR